MYNDYLTPLRSLTNKWPRGKEGWGAMDNDYRTPVSINKQVVKREGSGGGKEGGHG